MSICVHSWLKSPLVSTALSGCARLKAEAAWERQLRLASSATSEPLDDPKDGEILVFIVGWAREAGQFGVRANANLADIEDLFTFRPTQAASESVVIVRYNAGGQDRLRFRIDKMDRNQKEKVKVNHGDWICFVWGGCLFPGGDYSRYRKPVWHYGLNPTSMTNALRSR